MNSLSCKKLFLFVLVTVFTFGVVTALLPEATAAQPPAQLHKNVNEPGREPYEVWVEFSQLSCQQNCSNFVSFGAVRLFDAPAVPDGKRLIVQWVSAELPSNNAFNSISFQTAPIISNQRAKWQYHGPYYVTGAAGTVWGMNSGAFFTYEAGESPHIRVRLGDANNFITTISIGGYLIDDDNRRR